MKTTLTKKKYTEKALPGMKAELGIENLMAIPRIAKIVVNVGIGKILKDTKHVEEVVQALEAITGQKVVMTKARKAIAGFKTREGLEIGARVTLHGVKMWSFLDRLLNIALPRVRDFQGIPMSSVDQNGNCNIGIKDHSIFSEIVPEKVQHTACFQITIVTTARNKAEGESLFRLVGVPFESEESRKERSIK
jgi:large subunit ribosomal protein L5